MRQQKTVPLGDGRVALVKEVTVKITRVVMSQADALKQLSITALLTNHFDELAALLGDCVEMPQGETLEDLTGSELIQVKNALQEVNADFLDLLGLAVPAPGKPESTHSTELASP